MLTQSEFEDYLKDTIRSWNPTAVKCYKLGCRCSKCHLLDGLELPKDHCRMKQAVLILVKKFGAPNSENYKVTKCGNHLGPRKKP